MNIPVRNSLYVLFQILPAFLQNTQVQNRKIRPLILSSKKFEKSEGSRTARIYFETLELQIDLSKKTINSKNMKMKIKH